MIFEYAMPPASFRLMLDSDVHPPASFPRPSQAAGGEQRIIYPPQPYTGPWRDSADGHPPPFEAGFIDSSPALPYCNACSTAWHAAYKAYLPRNRVRLDPFPGRTRKLGRCQIARPGSAHPSSDPSLEFPRDRIAPLGHPSACLRVCRSWYALAQRALYSFSRFYFEHILVFNVQSQRWQGTQIPGLLRIVWIGSSPMIPTVHNTCALACDWLIKYCPRLVDVTLEIRIPSIVFPARVRRTWHPSATTWHRSTQFNWEIVRNLHGLRELPYLTSFQLSLHLEEPGYGALRVATQDIRAYVLAGRTQEPTRPFPLPRPAIDERGFSCSTSLPSARWEDGL